MILTTNQTTYEVNMKYRNEITIKNGQKCIIRNGTFEDGPEVSTFFTTTHGEPGFSPYPAGLPPDTGEAAS